MISHGYRETFHEAYRPTFRPTTWNDRIFAISFWSFAAIVILNLNGAIRMMMGIDAALSSAILILSGIVVLLRSSNRIDPPVALVLVALAAYLIIGLLSVIDNPFVSNELIRNRIRAYGASMIIVLAAAFGAKRIVRDIGVRRFMQRLLVLSLLANASVALGAVLPALYANVDFDKDVRRFSGFFANPNEAGIAGCVTIALAFALTRFESRTRLVIAGVVVGALATIASFSRTAILAAVLLVVVQMFPLRGSGRKSLVRVVAAMLLLGVVWLTLFHRQSIGISFDYEHDRRLSQIADIVLRGELNDATSGRRLSLAREGLVEWRQAPLAGRGIGSMHALRGIELGVHNTFLMILGESGILAAAALCVAAMVWTRSALRSRFRPIKAAIVGYGIVLFVYCMSAHTVLDERNHAFFIGSLGCLLAVTTTRTSPGAVPNRSTK